MTRRQLFRSALGAVAAPLLPDPPPGVVGGKAIELLKPGVVRIYRFPACRFVVGDRPVPVPFTIEEA